MAPLVGPSLQMRQLHIKDGGLQAVHAAVDALHHVLALAAMPRERGHPISEPIIIGDNASRVAVRSKVFAWIKGEGSCVSECSDHFAFVTCEVGLGAIFNHPELVLLRDG